MGRQSSRRRTAIGFCTPRSCAQSAAAIVVVPLDEQATLLEVGHFLANRDLTSKTIFLMPPTNLHFSALLKRLWRISIGRSWRAARGKLVAEEANAPSTLGRAFHFCRSGSGECHPAPLKDCNADYLRSLVDLASRRRALSPTEFSKASRQSREHYQFGTLRIQSCFFSSLGVALRPCNPHLSISTAGNIPSGSMKPTLLVGEFLCSYRNIPYGYSHYSLPMSPSLFSGRIFGSEPSRGDVVVFRLLQGRFNQYIKRVIGLPRATASADARGPAFTSTKAGDARAIVRFRRRRRVGSNATARVKRWKETLPNGVSYETLDCVDNGFYDNTNVYTVPANHSS